MWVAIFATVVCRVIFSILFGITLNMGVIGITWAMICDWAVKAVLIVGRYRSGKWKRFQVI
jgi:Na+-driven multidrug efflux pump